MPSADADQPQTAQSATQSTPSAPVQTSDLLQALPDETVLLPELRALVLAPALTPRPSATGVVLALDDLDGLQPLQTLLAQAIGKPASRKSLERIQTAVRIYCHTRIRWVVSVSLPPQDITRGVVTLLVKPTHMDGAVQVEGSRWFTPDQYRDDLLLTDRGVDTAAIERHVAWLNRNPYRRVTPELSPGAEPGTTQVTLQVREKFPFRFHAGYDNTGTQATSENRVYVSGEWGNALGGVLKYTFRADPEIEFLESHLLNGTWWMHSGSTLTAYAAYNEVRGNLPEPFDQGGTTWQLGMRYIMPWESKSPGFSHRVTFGFDFKSSDNNLLFGGIPVVDSLTHVAQLNLGYSASWRDAAKATRLATSLFLSPGGLTGANDNADFDASQLGAQAQYAYGTVDISHQRRLLGGFGWRLRASAQLSSAHLLPSEQMVGTGAGAVRGYAENLITSDNGIIVHNELMFPPIADGLQLFLFHDIGHLWDSDEPFDGNYSADLHSAGLGLSWRPNAHFDLSAVYGQQLKRIVPGEDARLHLRANVHF